MGDGMLYQHTQVGWVILAVFGAGWLAVAAQPGLAREPGAWILFAIFAAVLANFGTLRVGVDRDTVTAAFGIGLIRRVLPVRDVVAWRPVRNPWYAGWGIRLGPGGVLWNVSGLDAIEFDLRDGRRFRLGTDEPEELSRALLDVLGPPVRVH